MAHMRDVLCVGPLCSTLFPATVLPGTGAKSTPSTFFLMLAFPIGMHPPTVSCQTFPDFSTAAATASGVHTRASHRPTTMTGGPDILAGTTILSVPSMIIRSWMMCLWMSAMGTMAAKMPCLRTTTTTFTMICMKMSWISWGCKTLEDSRDEGSLAAACPAVTPALDMGEWMRVRTNSEQSSRKWEMETLFKEGSEDL